MSYTSQLVTRGQTLLSPSRRPVGGGIKRAFDFARCLRCHHHIAATFSGLLRVDRCNITRTDFVLSSTTWLWWSRFLLFKIPHDAG